MATDDRRPQVAGRVASAPEDARNQWFRDHIEAPVIEITKFLEGTGLSFQGARVLDVGCGDGFIDLGIVRSLKPDKVFGMDLELTDVEQLRELARKNLNEELPHNLDFGICSPMTIPLPDESFDIVMSWSVFEHVSNPVAVLGEMRRILRPGGFMFLQIWPLYFSRHGSHLWNWNPDGWEHLTRDHQEIKDEVAENLKHSDDLLKATNIDFDTLNRITLDELQRSISVAGFKIRRLGLQADIIDIPESLLRYRLSDLAISGVKLIATR
jgi:ubiquinone/menaquinone biosynthesis C-methylase UbiE